MTKFRNLIWVLLFSTATAAAQGPLKVSTINPRYFTDASGKAIYLAGSHTWDDIQTESDLAPLDFNSYLSFLQQHGHNFTRGWAEEQAKWAPWTTAAVTFSPLPYARLGPGLALDGQPRFDLTQFNQPYFDNLRSRVVAAGNVNIYFAVMLFEGWSVGTKPGEPGNAWPGHPFNAANNVNGVKGDFDADGFGYEIQTLASSTITRLQEAYVEKVVDTLNDLDNVIWEISNESNADSVNWQYHFISFLHSYEATKPKQHAVWMTVPYPDGINSSLYSSSAEAIAPNMSVAGDGSKVVVLDTDHLCGVCGDDVLVWQSFTIGLNFAFMDDFNKQWEPARRAMGQTVYWSKRIDLVHMVPRGDLTSTGYALANPGAEYIVYQSETQNPTFTVTLAAGTYNYEWMNTGTGTITARQIIAGGKQSFKPPFSAPAVLHIWR